MNFPEIWLARAIILFTSLGQAPWLDGIPELDTQILEAGSGTASEENLIHIPLDAFEVDVLLNNTTYPIATQPFTDGTRTVQLDKYQTLATSLSDDQINGASYPKIDSAVKAHDTGIRKNKFMKAIHALAPASDNTSTPVLETTGAVLDGRKKMVYADLVALKRKFDTMEAPIEGRRLVLSGDHYNDLMDDRDRFANLINNIPAGKLAPEILGFEIYQFNANPYFFKDTANANTWTKKPFGSVINPTTDKQVSVCFIAGNVAKKTGSTKQYLSLAKDNPTTQTNLLNYRHYFLTLPNRQKYMAAVVSATAA